jgi:predicted DNA binding CopG/RHH family protein
VIRSFFMETSRKKRFGRPTTDPKPLRVTLRLGKSDLAALRKLAASLGVTTSDALRSLLRGSPKSKTSRKRSVARRPS